MRIVKFSLLLCCFYITGSSYTYSEEIVNEKTLVELPNDIKEKTLVLMRDHIRALEEIIHAIQIEEYDKAEKIAESRLGWGASSRHEDSEVIKHWPKPMQAMADRLYHAASNYVTISKDAAIEDSKENDQHVIVALGEVVTACRACHESYRIR